MMKNKKMTIILSSILALTGSFAMTQSQAAAGLQTIAADKYATYAKTKNPIVMVPGMFGFTRLGTSAFGMDYFYQVLPDLARNGATAFTAQVSPLESTAIRGEQLLTQVEEVLAITGKSKVNLIGHSHGGPTALYIASVKPQYVASLTGVAGTFKGSKVADDLLSTKASSTLVGVFGDMILAPIMTWAEGNPSLPINMERSLKSISVAGSSQFNLEHPTAAIPSNCSSNGLSSNNGTYYYSWAGASPTTNIFDTIDTAIGVLAPLSYGNRNNDGLVTPCSSHFGKVIRDNYDLTHLEEINLILGMRGLFSPDPVALFRQHANRLKLQGL